MFQHLWSLPISMSLTRPNHRTNNQIRSILTSHTHTHTQYTDTHTNNTCIPHFTHTHTGTIQRHTHNTCISHTHRHTHNTCIHTSHTHTHTHTQTGSSLRTGTLSFLFWYPSPCPRQGLAPGRYPTAAPWSFFPGPPDWSQIPSCVLYVSLLIAVWVSALK